MSFWTSLISLGYSNNCVQITRTCFEHMFIIKLQFRYCHFPSSMNITFITFLLKPYMQKTSRKMKRKIILCGECNTRSENHRQQNEPARSRKKRTCGSSLVSCVSFEMDALSLWIYSNLNLQVQSQFEDALVALQTTLLEMLFISLKKAVTGVV